MMKSIRIPSRFISKNDINFVSLPLGFGRQVAARGTTLALPSRRIKPETSIGFRIR
jgi:hypothetical protein